MGKSIASFKILSDTESQNYLAQCYPKGKLWAKRFDSGSIIYKLILCLSQFIKMVTGQINTLALNIDIGQAYELLTEWEASVGIPSQYFSRTVIADRQTAIKRLISKNAVYNFKSQNIEPRTVNDYSTIENFVYIMTGITITITRGDIVNNDVFIVLVTISNVSIPDTLRYNVNQILQMIMPSNMVWNIQAYSSTPFVFSYVSPPDNVTETPDPSGLGFGKLSESLIVTNSGSAIQLNSGALLSTYYQSTDDDLTESTDGGQFAGIIL